MYNPLAIGGKMSSKLYMPQVRVEINIISRVLIGNIVKS